MVRRSFCIDKQKLGVKVTSNKCSKLKILDLKKRLIRNNYEKLNTLLLLKFTVLTLE